MEAYKEISSTVDSWVAEEELPAGARLKVIHVNDPDYGSSEDDLDERYEFIQWYMMQDFVPLLRLPKPERESDFFIADYTTEEEGYNAFNTHDFQDELKPFNKYGYAMKKLMERVKDLAILHSCISSPEGRERTYKRYLSFVEHHFRERLMSYVEQYQHARTEERKLGLKQKIGEMNRRVIEAKMIWERYAPWDR